MCFLGRVGLGSRVQGGFRAWGVKGLGDRTVSEATGSCRET